MTEDEQQTWQNKWSWKISANRYNKLLLLQEATVLLYQMLMPNYEISVPHIRERKKKIMKDLIQENMKTYLCSSHQASTLVIWC